MFVMIEGKAINLDNVTVIGVYDEGDAIVDKSKRWTLEVCFGKDHYMHFGYATEEKARETMDSMVVDLL